MRCKAKDGYEIAAMEDKLMLAEPAPRGLDIPSFIAVYLSMIVLLLAGILWALWPSALSNRYDPGGSILKYAVRAESFTGPLPDYCASACTLYMLHGCVRPEMTLIFHLPSVDHFYWRDLMAGHYPPAIASWFASLPSDTPPVEMSGAEAVNRGAAPC